MANPTTNYAFAMPTNTDLVKDLPADFEIFGQAVDTQMKTNADAAILKSIVDAKGDLIVASGSDAVARLAVGTNDYVLTADSAATNGVKWAALPASGGMTLISTTTFNDSAATYTLTSIPQTYKHLMLVGSGLQTSNATTDTIFFRFNGDTGNNYSFACSQVANGASQAHSTLSGSKLFGGTNTIANMALTGDASARFGNFVLQIFDYTDVSYKSINYNGGSHSDGNGWNSPGRGLWNDTAAITSITMASNVTVNIKAGIVRLYGVS